MSDPKPRRQAAIAFIIVTLVLDAMAYGIANPVLPSLIGTLGRADPAQKAEVFGVFGTLFFIMQFFSSPLQGALSDARGRRTIILFSTFGMALDYVIMALAPSIGWLYVGRLISGITAGSMTAAFAYLIDVTPLEQRARIFSLGGAAISVGTTLGPALGGFAGSYNLRLPFWIAAGLAVLSLLYGLLVLPESLKPESRAPFRWHNANPIGAMYGIVRDYPALVGWAMVLILYNLAVMGVNNIVTVYTSYRYGWTPRDLGVYLSAIGLWTMATQSVIVPLLLKWLTNRQSLLVGSIAMALAIAAAGLMPAGVGYAMAAFVWIVGLMLMSAIVNTLISSVVGPSDQGRVQGGAGSLNSVVGLAAPGLFAFLLATAIRGGGKPLSGLPYLLSGVLTLIGLVFAARMIPARSAAETPGSPITD